MVQVAVLLETEEVVHESYQSTKSARLQSGAIRKVPSLHLSFSEDVSSILYIELLASRRSQCAIAQCLNVSALLHFMCSACLRSKHLLTLLC